MHGQFCCMPSREAGHLEKAKPRLALSRATQRGPNLSSLDEQLVRLVQLRNRIKLLECAGERVRQAPHRPGRKLRILRLEVQTMHLGQ